MHKSRRKCSPIIVFGGIAVTCIAIYKFLDMAYQRRYVGVTPQHAAHILVHDGKYGMRSIKRCISYGDRVIPALEAKSDNFQQLGTRNSFWIAEVLGSIKTKRSRRVATELYRREEILPYLTGATALCMQGTFPDPIDETSRLVKIAKEGNTYGELAIIALSHSKSDGALPFFYDLLSKPAGYTAHQYACQGIARIRNPQSISVLQMCLQNPDFDAVRHAYRAAICLGDKNATALAIEHVSENLRNHKFETVIDELERVTGEKHGFDQAAWKQWWEANKTQWQIPKKFSVEWDAQP